MWWTRDKIGNNDDKGEGFGVENDFNIIYVWYQIRDNAHMLSWYFVLTLTFFWNYVSKKTTIISFFILP